MTKRSTDPISIHKALGEFVSENKLQKGIDNVNVLQAWYQLNPAFKKYTAAIRFDRDTLIVNLNSSVLREELSYGREQLRSQLNEILQREIVKELVLR